MLVSLMEESSSRTAQEWQAYAANDPLYAVASWEGKQDGGWNFDDFYALGRSDWEDFKQRWAHYTDLNGVCLEIGSGAGRITAPMSETVRSRHRLRCVRRHAAPCQRDVLRR